MQTTYEPLTAVQKAELRGYVSWGVRLVRAILFLATVLLVAASLRSIHSSFAPKQGFGANPWWWILPSLAFTTWFHFCWQRWTGGRRGKTGIQSDLARGEVAVHHIQIVDAIEIEEAEDEGPSYFILTADGEVLYFSGQWLDREKRRGFPWNTFEILEAPDSKVFFRLKKTGERFPPSYVRKPLGWETMKEFGAFKGRYRLLNENFELLKRDPANLAVEK